MLLAKPRERGKIVIENINRNNIPVWANIRDSNLTLTNKDRAKYVLSHISYYNSTGCAGYGSYRIGSYAFRAQCVRVEDFWVYYTRTDEPAVHLPPPIKRNISAMYSEVADFDFSEYFGLGYLRVKLRPDKSEMSRGVRAEPPQKGEFERAKVTSEHHTHYRPEEVWKVIEKAGLLKKACQIVLNKLRLISGMTEACVATFLAYLLLCRPQVAYFVATSRYLWEVVTVSELATRLKEVSTPLKSLHRYDMLDLSEMFELQVLVNRGIGGIDWSKEHLNRISPNVVKVDCVKVYDEARRIFSDGVTRGFKYNKMNIDKYLASRWEWVPTGSVHSQYEEDKVYIKKNYRHRTKFVTLNMMRSARLRMMFQRQPQIRAWASVKYEWAKQRAIYGTDLTSSVITNFCMFRCEEVLKHRFPIGEEASDTRVHKRLKMMLENAESFCYDFDDFNAQHSVSSMYAVLCAYRDTFAREMSEEQLEAMEWVCESILDVKVYNNEVSPPVEYKMKGTLLSGWRLTTFINTILNYIYFKLSGALEVGGCLDSVHNGDDVLMSIENIATAAKMSARMEGINARAQASKCNVFSIGEFLRVEHRVDKE